MKCAFQPCRIGEGSQPNIRNGATLNRMIPTKNTSAKLRVCLRDLPIRNTKDTGKMGSAMGLSEIAKASKMAEILGFSECRRTKENNENNATIESN